MSALPIVTIDREVCIGSGQCVNYAPDAFTQDAEAKAVLLPRWAHDREALDMAVAACPTGALELTTAGKGSV